MGADEQKLLPQILKMPWTFLDSAEAEVHHIIVNQMEFYTISHAGNLMFTPEDISATHLRFINYPTVEKTWPVWVLSESDIKGVAARFGLDIEVLPHRSPFQEEIHAFGRFLGLFAEGSN